MRVSLFGLSPWRINFVNPYFELVQLVLLILVFIACLCAPMLSTLFSMHAFWFRLIDIHVFTWFRIYCRSFNFFYVTCDCLYLHAWTTSLDHAHVWLPEHANWLYHMYSPGCFLTTLDSHVQILESGSWWPFCSWSECAAEAWISGCLSRPFFLPAFPWSAREILILLLVSTFPYFILYILFLCFLVILYSWDIVSCYVITVYLCYYCWDVYYHCASVLWFFSVLMLSVYTWGYFQPAYIRRSNVSVPMGSGRYRVVSEPRLSHLQYNQSAT